MSILGLHVWLVGAGAGATLLAAGIAALVFRRAGRDLVRRNRLLLLAEREGLKFRPGGVWEPPVACLHLDLFKDGVYREARNVLEGTASGRRFMIFDYHFSTYTGQTEHRKKYLVALFEMPINAPPLVLRSASLADALDRWVEQEDIDFESERFGRRYRVRCEDRKFAYDIFQPRVLEFFLTSDEVPILEMYGPFLALYDGPFPAPGVGDPKMARRFLEAGSEVVQSIPTYVRHERPSAPKMEW